MLKLLPNIETLLQVIMQRQQLHQVLINTLQTKLKFSNLLLRLVWSFMVNHRQLNYPCWIVKIFLASREMIHHSSLWARFKFLPSLITNKIAWLTRDFHSLKVILKSLSQTIDIAMLKGWVIRMMMTMMMIINKL